MLQAECDRRPMQLYTPELYWIAFQALDAAGDSAAATGAIEKAVRWIHDIALPNVPDAFRDSFPIRNPTNRAVLAVASRLPAPR